MKVNYHFAALSVCLLFLNFSLPKSADPIAGNTLSAIDLKPYGRTTIDAQQNLELISSAVHFGFSFEGKECSIYASIPDSKGHNYLQYELDGVYQKRIKVSGDSEEPIVLTVPTEGKHTIWIYKATEAATGPIMIRKIVANKVKSLKNSSAPLIEFIGNSITCGAAADPSEVPCGTGVYHDQHNAYMAYGPRVARKLNANYILSSVSGIGVYRNWNSDGPAMPQVYEKVDFRDKNTQLWNFNTYSPKIVSIALGTNDLSKGDGKKPRLAFDSTVYINSFVKFVQVIKSKYPRTQIALLSSPMVNGSSRVTLQNCLSIIKEKVDRLYPSGKPVALFFFEPMKARGCSGHPNVEDHLILANQLSPFFEKLLKSN